MSDELPKLEKVFTAGDRRPLQVYVIGDGVSHNDVDVTWTQSRPDGSVIQITGVDISAGGSKGRFEFGPDDLIAGCNQLVQIHNIEKVSGKSQLEGEFLIDVVPKLVVTP